MIREHCADRIESAPHPVMHLGEGEGDEDRRGRDEHRVLEEAWHQVGPRCGLGRRLLGRRLLGRRLLGRRLLGWRLLRGRLLRGRLLGRRLLGRRLLRGRLLGGR